MNNKCGMLNAECGRNAVKSCRAQALCPIPHSAFPIRSRRGLTLIELLVTIVIMVTVLAGVLPMISPNNNSRKIREASRQLSSLMAQAQAQAARDGRPYGIAFREFGVDVPYSGMALEAFTIAEPPAFAGFSEHSRVVVRPTSFVYGPGAAPANGGDRLGVRWHGQPICKLEFWASGGVDPFPPRTLKIGDTIHVAGNIFLICDDADQTTMPNKVELVGPNDSNNKLEYLLSDPSASAPVPGTELNGIWTNFRGQPLPVAPTLAVGQTYQISRQPTNTSDAPLQFPRGVGIDLQASGVSGVNLPTASISLDDYVDPSVSPPVQNPPKTIGVMFSPNGALDAVYVNGVRWDGVEQVFLLMGLFENGYSETQDPSDYDFTAGTSITNDDLALRRTRINWLSSDSRWVSANRAGRVITSENNTSFDPRQAPYSTAPTGSNNQDKYFDRLSVLLNGIGDGLPPNPTGARLYAKQMTGSSGR